MDVYKILAWIGLVVALPGFLLMFASRDAAVAVFALILIAGLIWTFWVLHRTDYTLLALEKTLTFQDGKASRATVERWARARANHKGLAEFWFRNIGADGPIENLSIDGKNPDVRTSVAQDIQVCKRFSPPLAFGEKQEMRLAYDALNAFEKELEFIAVIDQQIKSLRMVVNFHRDKPCKDAKAILGYSGYPEMVRPDLVIVSPDKLRATMEVKKPKRGSYYAVRWEW